MKMRLKWFVVPAVALGLGACKKEESAAKPETPAAAEEKGVVEKAVEKVKDAVAEAVPSKPAVSAEERAAKLGFAKHLPKDTESLISVYNAAKTADRAKALKLWAFIEEQMGTEATAAVEDAAKAADPAGAAAVPTDPAEAPSAQVPATEVPKVKAAEVKEDPADFSPKDLWGSEVTLALGKTSAEQVGNLLSLYKRFGYFQMRTMTKSLIASAKGKEGAGMAEMENPFNEQLISDVINDPEGGVGIFEKMGFPPIYIALKTAPAKREQAAQQISSSLGFIGSFGEFAEPVEVEKAGVKFAGYKISGAKLSSQLADAKGELEKTIEADALDRIIASLAKKDVVLVSGTVGDYVVLFLGGSVDQLELAADAKDSLAGADGLKFVDSYLSKDIAAVSCGDKASLQHLMEIAGGLGDTLKGVRDGLAGEDGLGDTREIESLLQVAIEREGSLRKLARYDASGSVAFFEEGFKIESFGGVDQGAIDWKAENKLSKLGDSPDAVLFFNTTVDPAYDKASREFIESLVQTAYAVTRKAAELPLSTDEFNQFKQATKLFDEKFRPDAIDLWNTFSGDFHEGLGRERALIVDLKGTVPALPGLPQPVVDQGKFPRISLIAPVVDRAKLASAWDKTNKSATSILAKVSEMAGQDIPMQKPLSSEKNGLTTWFFPMPFFNDDFLPSLTVGDQWFVASTSKNQAVDLAAQAAKGDGDKKGLLLKLNFVAIQTYAKEMLKVADANAAALFPEGELDEFNANKPLIEKGIATFDDFDSLTIRSNRDGGGMHTSLHFKTR